MTGNWEKKRSNFPSYHNDYYTNFVYVVTPRGREAILALQKIERPARFVCYTGAQMIVQFDFTSADMADVMQRTADRSASLGGWVRQSTSVWALLLSVVLFFLLPGESLARLVFAAVFFVAAYALYGSWVRRGRRDRFVKYVREQLGGDGPFRCVVEISVDGIIVKQGDVEMKRAWSGVKKVVEATGGIEITSSHNSLLLVRDRAFPTAELRAEFLQAVRNYMAGGAAPESATDRDAH